MQQKNRGSPCIESKAHKRTVRAQDVLKSTIKKAAFKKSRLVESCNEQNYHKALGITKCTIKLLVELGLSIFGHHDPVLILITLLLVIEEFKKE